MSHDADRPKKESSGLPFVRSIARHIIEELFKVQSQWKSSGLFERVVQLHRERGGSSVADPSFTIRRALQDLRDEGLVITPGIGWWRWNDSLHGDDPLPEESATSDTVLVGQSIEELEPIIKPEKELGDGLECVYLYFNPNDRRLAELECRNFWECKVGRTSSYDPNRRILGQGIRTALSRLPTIGLVLRTDDSAALESALHSSLRLIGAEVPASPGNEWFNTSPAHVEAWYINFQKALNAIEIGVISHQVQAATSNHL